VSPLLCRRFAVLELGAFQMQVGDLFQQVFLLCRCQSGIIPEQVLLTVGSQISQCFFIRHVYNPFLKNRCRTGSIVFGNLGNPGNPAEIPVSIGINTLYHNMQKNTSLFEKKRAFSK